MLSIYTDQGTKDQRVSIHILNKKLALKLSKESVGSNHTRTLGFLCSKVEKKIVHKMRYFYHSVSVFV